jgi:putative CocE/NonD family hydrolase
MKRKGASGGNQPNARGGLELQHSHNPPRAYDPPIVCDKIAEQRDVMVPMRDGKRLCIDIYRPDMDGRFPALLAIAPHNKEYQTPEFAKAAQGSQPTWGRLWFGGAEAGDSDRLVTRGYVHIIGNLRGNGKSDGGGTPEWDLYDLIEWIAKQPWCDCNVGMIGISAFGGAQFEAAFQQPPSLKAIFPYDPRGCYGAAMHRDMYPGGLVHTMHYLLDSGGVYHMTRGQPGPLPPDKEAKWREAMNNPDYLMYPNIFNVLVEKGQTLPMYFERLIDPYDPDDLVAKTNERLKKINIPFYTGAGWYTYSYKQHLQGAQQYFQNVQGVPKKILFTGPAHLERPFHDFHDEVLRWYDHWLKGKDTGILDEPPVKVWVMGENKWRTGNDWPLPETQWTKLYLTSWGRLRKEPFTPNARDGRSEPDTFVQMPPTQTNEIQRLRYMTDPLPEDTLVIGPMALYLHAAIDQDDTNWIIVVKDVGPDVSVRTARPGEVDVPRNLPERELTRGWLKASHRALDPQRSKLWRPWHPLTRKAQKKIVPGEINEYAIEILSTANMFKAGHRICIDITSLDLPSGLAGAHDVEYAPYHLCSSKTVVHKIYHNAAYPSHLILPVIPVK